MHYTLLEKVLKIKTEKELRKFIWKEEAEANLLNGIIVGIFVLAGFLVIPKSVFRNILMMSSFIIVVILMALMSYLTFGFISQSTYKRGLKDLKRRLNENGFLEVQKEIREFARGLNQFLVNSSKLDMREG